MPEITDVEVAKQMPEWQGKGATIYRYTVEGDDRRPEDFVVKGQNPKAIGDTVEIEDGDYGPRVKKAARGGGKGFGRSPAETKAIQRQHSQEMMLRLQALRGCQWTGDEMRSVINWFEKDINGKDRGVTWDGLSDDVPVDMSDTPFGGSS